MGLEEPHLDRGTRVLEQRSKISEPEAGVFEGTLGDALEFADRMLLGQVKQALQGADRLGTPMLEHGLSPRSAARPEEATAAEKILGATLDHGPLVGMDMLGICRKAPGLGAGVDGDLFHLGRENPDEPRLGAHPQLAADVLGWHGVVRPAELNVAVALNAAAGFLEAGKQARRQGAQGGLLGRDEELKDLLTHGPMNAGVGDGALPVCQKLVLLAQAPELAAPECVFLHVVDARLHLALVPGHGGLGGGKDRPVMAAELDQLGVEIGIEPVGPQDGGLQVVDDQPRGHAAKVPECVFQTPHKRVRGLAPDNLGVAFAGVAENAAEQMGPSSSSVFDHPSPAAKVCLDLLTWGTLHPPERQVASSRAAADKALHRLISAAESMVADQVLVDAHRR